MAEPVLRDWVTYLPNWLAAVAGVGGAVTGIIGALTARKAYRKSQESILLAKEANEIALKSISENLSGTFKIDENTPEQSKHHKWCADLKIQNTGGRDLQLLDVEFLFDNGHTYLYTKDFPETHYSKPELPLTIKAQETVPLLIYPGDFILHMIQDDGDLLFRIVGISAIDYQEKRHQLSSNIAREMTTFIHEWFQYSLKWHGQERK